VHGVCFAIQNLATNKLKNLLAIGMLMWIGGCNTLIAQNTTVKKFSRDSLVFTEELEKLMRSDQTRQKEGKEFMKEFLPFWQNEELTGPMRERIYFVLDRMVEKNMLPFPYFALYLGCNMAYIKAGRKPADHKDWHSAVEQLLEGRQKRRYEDFLTFSLDLFKESALHKSHANTWITSNPDYKIYWKGEPIVEINELDLVCFAKHDSAFIYETKGIYYPMQKLWIGRGGIVNWQRTGYDENKVIARIKDYRIEMNHSYYKADSAEFTNTFYFGNARLMGELEDKLLANVEAEESVYPRFDSYNDNLVIRNLFPNIDYKGGFTQKGVTFIGKGTAEEPAEVTIKRNGKPFVIARAGAFSIREDKLFGEPAEVMILLSPKDTLFHPGVSFKYLDSKKEMTLFRNNKGREKGPFVNSLHKIVMYNEELVWNLNTNTFLLKPLIGNTDRTALFESQDYYQSYIFDDLYGLARIHPLVILKKCTEKYMGTQLTVSDVCDCWQLPASQIKPELIALSIQGFVRYNYNKDEVRVLPKTFNYVSARLKKVDYDNIQWQSSPAKANNAELNLDSLSMSMHGIKPINLSDSHSVIIFPKNGEVLMRPNRDMDFDGVVRAGKLLFFGSNFKFEYDSFLIRMPKIDSMIIYVELEEKDKFGNPVLKQVQTVIENIEGKLEVDKYNNKSGKRSIKRWPVFTSYRESFAYYDRIENEEIPYGVYNRKDFYFKLEPFQFDSLDNFKNSSIKFGGTFASGGIFEDFEETIVLQTDYSLGFTHKTPEEGVPIYGGKGTFTNDISLSHSGLKGDGAIQYITSTTEDNSFYFFPDLARAASVDQYAIEEQYPGPPEYPTAIGKELEWHWYPSMDTMTVATTDETPEPIMMYSGNSTYRGTLIYNPDSLIGTGEFGKKGHFEFDKAVVESKNIRFKFYGFDSDTADFALKTGKLGDLGFDTKNMRAHVDFKGRKGYFYANGDASEIIFKTNQYMAKMDQFTWEMDNDIVDLSGKKRQIETGAGGAVSIEGARLTSIKKHSKNAQDSLYFFSSSAKFDLVNEIITADKVEFIDVADVEIHPDSGRLVIYEAARMRPLKNAEIIANKTARYHRIYGAELAIANRIEFKGKGNYDYKDVNSSIQKIVFDDIHVTSQIQTVANGKLEESDDFTLSPAFKYFGNIVLEASRELLTFTGYTQMVHDCPTLQKPWIKFISPIDPGDVMIPIDTATRTSEGLGVNMGHMLGTLPYRVYTSYVTPPDKPNDPIVSEATGVMLYNARAKEYRIGSERKVNIPNLTGNYLVLNTETCVSRFEGEHGFGMNTGRVEVRPVGNITQELRGDSIILKMALYVSFYFEEKALRTMAKEFEDLTDHENINADYFAYNYALKTLLGEKEGEKLKAEMALTGKMKRVPDVLNNGIFFTELEFYWNPQKLAFQTKGNLGVGNILKSQVNKYLEGHIEIAKKAAGDRFTIYLRTKSNHWYFFSYVNEVMEAVATDDKFNAAVKDAKKNKLEREKGKARYRFTLTNKNKADIVIRQF
jgi:hypothetical protein